MPKKIILDVNETTWKRVLKYKIDHDLRNNNNTVVKLISLGLGKKNSRD